MSTGTLRYEAVLFDVGGTLIGFSDPAPFREFLEEAGLPADAPGGEALHARFLDVIRAQRQRAVGVGASDVALDDFWRGMFARVWPARPDLAAEMFRWFRADRFDRVAPDAVQALAALRALGLPLAVVSNFTGDLENLLGHLGLRGFFDFVVVSAKVGLAKPDPSIFHLAVDRLGLPPQRLLYVGDHFEDDVEGARGAGLDAVLIDRGFRRWDERCARVRSLAELSGYVQVPCQPARAFLFDLDGVILDSTEAHISAWQDTLGPLGLDMRLEHLLPVEGMPTAPMARLLVERLGGWTCTDDEARRLAQTKRTLYLERLRPRAIPGSRGLLRSLKGRGYRLALVTGSARVVVEGILPALGLDGTFEAVVTADDVRQGKPHPEPYQTAALRLGLAPADCLVVENAPMGVESAKAAGMRCLALETTLPASQLPGADLAFPDVAALEAWILGW